MRRSSAQLPEVLTGAFTRSVRFDVWHGVERVAEGLRAEAWSLDGDLGAEVKQSGDAVIVHDSVAGESMKPDGTGGILSPLRAVVEPIVTITAGDFAEDVSLGQFKVVAVPSASEYTADGPSGRVVTASRVEVEFESLDRVIWRRGFQFPENAVRLASCWAEIRRITGFPVAESVPDKPIVFDPERLDEDGRAPAWEAKQGSRLEAVQQLASVLGGVAVIDSSGALTVIPDEVGEPVAEITTGDSGTILELEHRIETDGVYNEVVGTFEKDDEQRTPFYAVAQVTEGPLSVSGPYGVYTRYYSSDLVKTQEQAQAAVEAVLAQSVAGQTYDVPVSCLFNPLLEIGDVVALVTAVPWRPVRVIGRIVSLRLSESAVMQLTVRVARRFG